MTRRRVIILAVIYLVCGFAVSVLVAWGCVIGIAYPPGVPWLPPAKHKFVWVEPLTDTTQVTNLPSGISNGLGSFFVRSAGGKEEVGIASRWPSSESIGKLAADLPPWAFSLAQDLIDHQSGATPAMSRLYVRAEAAGWPWHSLLSYEIPLRSGGIRHWAIRLRGGLSHDLPLRPIWPGAFWNTLLYAAILLGLHQSFRICHRPLRRTLRKRRGLCPRCKYNLRGALKEGCPECGWGGG